MGRAQVSRGGPGGGGGKFPEFAAWLRPDFDIGVFLDDPNLLVLDHTAEPGVEPLGKGRCVGRIGALPFFRLSLIDLLITELMGLKALAGLD